MESNDFAGNDDSDQNDFGNQQQGGFDENR